MEEAASENGSKVSDRNKVGIKPPLVSTPSCFGFAKRSQYNEDAESYYSNNKAIRTYYLCGCFISIPVFFLCIITAIVMWCTNIYGNQLLKIVTLKETNVIYDIWINPSVHNLVSFHAFNYTNTEKAIAGIEKLKVVDVGPYVFREIVKRVNIVNNMNGTLTYQEDRRYEFVPELSSGDMMDTIIAPNMLLMTMLAQIESSSFIERLPMRLYMGGAQPFIKISVADFTWGHSDQALVNLLRTLSTFSKHPMPDKLGILAERSGLGKERITLGTDLMTVGMVNRVNGKDRLGLWEGEECDSVDASMGIFFPGATLTRDSVLHIYIKSFCRRVPLVYEEDILTEGGLPAYRFTYKHDAFSRGEDNPENECFCNGPSCPPSGAFSTSRCSYGAPVVVSYPHFLYGDPVLVEAIEGLNPDQKLHGSRMDIHAKYGIALAGDSRFQIGIILNKIYDNKYGKIPNGTVFPMAWMGFGIGELTPGVKDVLYHLTFTSEIIKSVISWGSLALIFVSGLAIIYLIKKRFSAD